MLFYERSHARHKMKYWELIADNLSKAGFSWGVVSAIDSNGRTIWIADAHRDDGKRFVVDGGRIADRVYRIGISDLQPPAVVCIAWLDPLFLVSKIIAGRSTP